MNIDSNQKQLICDALKPYGAHLTDSNFIAREKKATSVKAVLKRGRLRFESEAGTLLFSGGLTSSAVENFVEKFWFWKKLPTL